MTSIKHLKYPNITKLDGRYKGYNRGFRYRITFDTHGVLWERWHRVTELLKDAYGKESQLDGSSMFSKRIWNENYRTEVAKNTWYRHLYLRNEQDITMILLVVE